jgi:hypothetical protein
MTEEHTKPAAKKRKAATTPTKQTPVHVIREGGIAASIWEKTTGHGMTYLYPFLTCPSSPRRWFML